MASNYYEGKMREFESGATRHSDLNKIDYEGHLNPAVLEAFGQYMHRCRECPDGTYRDSDNWQLGLPKDAYMKSLLRHVIDVWKHHRKIKAQMDLKSALCAVMFNVMGYLLEVLRDEQAAEEGIVSSDLREGCLPLREVRSVDAR